MTPQHTCDWTGDATSVTIWDGRSADLGSLSPQTEFKLWGWRWRVERQARRTTFARAANETFRGCRLQLKKSVRVEIATTFTKGTP